ncbi:MAG: DUF4011 domain-containing protein [Bdellovibrionales bacterium]|nr:DUF4011 domain-containing protein [Bdellovibrionales bacterium]
MNRFDDWKKKLLNLTKRNPFISFTSKTSIPLLCKNLSSLEDEIARGNPFQISSKYNYANKTVDDLGDSHLTHDVSIDDREVEKILKDKNTILSNLNELETKKYLQNMHTKNRLYMQETGNNIVFLSLGFLSYLEGKQKYKAPLVLIPIVLSRKSNRSGYSFRANSDEAEFNLSLLEYLKNRHEIYIPELEEDLPLDESGIDLDKIFDIFNSKIEDIEDWNIEAKESYISLFKFQKITMFRDLEDYSEHFKSHPLLEPLNKSSNVPFSPLNWKNNDLKSIDFKNIFCTMDYDSSQLRAVLEADSGSSFILQGPPGTGKSQTITNVISQLLCKGKKVLFVAQKKVALDVVKQRLEDIGIGDFLLDIHLDESINISKQLSHNYQLIENYSEDVQGSCEHWEQKIDELKESKKKIDDYYNVLHDKHMNGMSAFESLSCFVSHKDDYPKIDVSLISLDQLDEKHLNYIKDQIRKCDQSMQHIDYNVRSHSLSGIKVDWTKEKQDLLVRINKHILDRSNSCMEKYDAWYRSIFVSDSLQNDVKFYDIKIFIDLLNHLNIGQEKIERYRIIFDKNFIFDQDFTEYVNQAIKAVERWNGNIIKNILTTEHKNNLPHLENVRDHVTILKSQLVQNLESLLSLENSDSHWKKVYSIIRNVVLFCKRLNIQFRIYRCIKNLCVDLSWVYLFKTQSIRQIIQSFEDFIECKKEMNRLSSVFPKDFSLWRKEDTVKDDLVSFNSWRNDLGVILNKFEFRQMFVEHISVLVKSHFQKIENNFFKDNTLELISMIGELEGLLKQSKDTGMDFYLTGFQSVKDGLIHLQHLSKRRKEDMFQLRGWLNYCEKKENLMKNKHLLHLVQYMDDSRLDLMKLEDIFMYNYHREWIAMFFRENNAFLKGSYKQVLEDYCKDFKAMDAQILNLCRKKLRSRIILNAKKELEKLNELNPKDSRTLHHEAMKKRRHKSIRELFQEIPKLIKCSS